VTQTTEGLTPTIPVTWSTKKHSLQGIWPAAPDCEIELRVEDGGQNLFTVDQTTSELTLNVGVLPGSYDFAVVAYLKDFPEATDMSYTSPSAKLDVIAVNTNLDCSTTEIVAQDGIVVEHYTSGTADPTESTFNEFQDLAALADGDPTLCGPRAYSLAANSVGATLDSAGRKITVAFQSDDHEGEANQEVTLDLTVELVD